MDILIGQRIPITEFLPNTNQAFQVELSITDVSVDFSCFGLNAANKLLSDEYMIFFNQPKTLCGGVSLTLANNFATFICDLNKLPANIESLCFTAAIDGLQTMNQMQSGYLRFLNNDHEVARFNFSGLNFNNEKSLLLGDIYRKNGQWRFNAFGQGFNGGLSALLEYFGGEEDVVYSENNIVSTSQIITLTKKNESHKVSLLKGIDAPKKILVSATWVDNGDGSDKNDDLDLRVGILLPDGRMKIIQAPDKAGSFSSDPYVFHTGDVTTASLEKPGIETVEINPEISTLLGGRIALVFSVYSAVSNGIVSIASLKPKMRMEYGDQIVECSFEFKSFFGSSCVYTYVIGIIEIDQNNVTLRPSGETSSFMSEATPWLEWSGGKIKLTMDGSPVFKGKPISSIGKKTYS